MNGNGTAAKAKTESEVSEESGKTGLLFQPRLGLGSTDNENIALRRNYRELELLCRQQKMLTVEQEYMMKILELDAKSIQVNYLRLTKRVGRIRSHLTEEEIKEMENDVQKRDFANKYRKILREQKLSSSGEEDERDDLDVELKEGDESHYFEETIPSKKLPTITEQSSSGEIDSKTSPKIREQLEGKFRSQTSNSPRKTSATNTQTSSQRPVTCPVFGAKSGSKNLNDTDESESFGEIIPSLEDLLDQLHNIKPQQFYENQRKLKLYDIQLLCEELETRKETLFKNVDAIINWDKKEEKETEEEARKREEEEESKKPLKRKTTFMRSVLRNFSMELMMKTMQFGWTDLGKCRYLRNNANEEGDTSGVNTLAANSMKIRLPTEEPGEDTTRAPPRIEPGFTADGKMIRTADLLGLKSYD